jgi:hypothetical protein
MSAMYALSMQSSAWAGATIAPAKRPDYAGRGRAGKGTILARSMVAWIPLRLWGHARIMRSLRHWPAILALAALAGSGQAVRAATATMPTAPLQAYLESERGTGAERSEPLARALLWTAARAPHSERAAYWALAAQADPGLPDPHWSRACAALRQLDIAEFVSAANAALAAVRRDARAEARALRGTVRDLHALLTATLLTLAALVALRSLPLVRHALGEALGSATAATLLVAVPCVAAFLTVPAIGSLLVLVAMAPFLRRREARVLAVPCLLLAGLELSLRWCAPHALLLDPRTRSAGIAYLNDRGHDAALESTLRDATVRRAEVELVLGLQARRRGDIDGAERHYLAALRADSTCAAAYVDLANLFFRRGDFGRAATGYRAAQTIAAGDPLAYANLAQTYIRMTQFSDSDRELRAAAARGMADVTRRRGLWRDEALPVFDATLSRDALLHLARDEAAERPSLAATAIESWRSRPWRGMRTGVAPVALVLVAAWLFAGLRLRRVAVACLECGTVLCTHCIALSPGDDRCNSCQVARPRPRPVSTDLLPPERRRRVSLASGRWIAPIFPGAADLVRGTPAAALVAVLCTWFAILIAWQAVDAARLRFDPWWAGGDLRALQAAAIVVGLLWLPGLWRLRARELQVRGNRQVRSVRRAGITR